MEARRVLRKARRLAGLSQRDLAEASGVKQPAIARIESGAVIPRIDTLDRLLRACGQDLRLSQRLGEGVDRTLIREFLGLTPTERLRAAVEAANNLQRIKNSVRRI